MQALHWRFGVFLAKSLVLKKEEWQHPLDNTWKPSSKPHIKPDVKALAGFCWLYRPWPSLHFLGPALAEWAISYRQQSMLLSFMRTSPFRKILWFRNVIFRFWTSLYFVAFTGQGYCSKRWCYCWRVVISTANSLCRQFLEILFESIFPLVVVVATDCFSSCHALLLLYFHCFLSVFQCFLSISF